MAAVHIAVVLRVACGLVGCALLYLTWFRWRRLGVEVCPDGIRIRRAQVQRRRVAWSEIESFCAIPKSPYPAVGAKLKTGEVIRTGLVQGRKMLSADDATKDILAALNRELEHSGSAPLGF
jgi:hypothetical protein